MEAAVMRGRIKPHRRFGPGSCDIEKIMRALLLILAFAVIAYGGLSATNDTLPVRTNLASGAALSNSDLAAVLRLASLCGLKRVTEISTDRRLSGVKIEINGDETFEGRCVTYKSLQVHRVGWERLDRPANAMVVGEFWAESSKLGQQERTLVDVGGRKMRVGLLNGIKPAGADKILGAFGAGRVRFREEAVKKEFSRINMSEPSWIGISGGTPWIIFTSDTHTRFQFTLDGDEVVLLDSIRVYE